MGPGAGPLFANVIDDLTLGGALRGKALIYSFFPAGPKFPPPGGVFGKTGRLGPKIPPLKTARKLLIMSILQVPY